MNDGARHDDNEYITPLPIKPQFLEVFTLAESTASDSHQTQKPFKKIFTLRSNVVFEIFFLLERAGDVPRLFVPLRVGPDRKWRAKDVLTFFLSTVQPGISVGDDFPRGLRRARTAASGKVSVEE